MEDTIATSSTLSSDLTSHLVDNFAELGLIRVIRSIRSRALRTMRVTTRSLTKTLSMLLMAQLQGSLIHSILVESSGPLLTYMGPSDVRYPAPHLWGSWAGYNTWRAINHEVSCATHAGRKGGSSHLRATAKLLLALFLEVSSYRTLALIGPRDRQLPLTATGKPPGLAFISLRCLVYRYLLDVQLTLTSTLLYTHTQRPGPI